MIHNSIRPSPWLSEVASAGNPHINQWNTVCYNSWSVTPVSANTQMKACKWRQVQVHLKTYCFCHPPMQTLVLEQTAFKQNAVVVPQHNHSLHWLLLNFLKSKFGVIFCSPPPPPPHPPAPRNGTHSNHLNFLILAS
jgi:hypothetical protein